MFAPYSNMLHKCPYDHDVFVNKLPIGYLDHMLSNVLPVRVEVLKRLNGYKPFLFNFTVDACKFLKGQQKTIVTQFFYDMFAPYSNILHKCPYDKEFTAFTVFISFIKYPE
ncbi:uncharacterized protein Dana_GF26689 [Drosophila ananassae]|uniref:Uncharacterized protein n=1 Tax=Drosophila ananassae TaxID=7217 RepID=A0A0P8YDB8_DROAN|nr:uncharacterized protein Dana_GF26689 [Drosophila ananassae]